MTGDLFGGDDTAFPDVTDGRRAGGTSAGAPLADRMRPRALDDVVGQRHLLGPDGPLRRLLATGTLPSLLLWGPPGCGKTTLARLVAGLGGARFLEYSAVAVGSKELKEVMTESGRLQRATGRRTILFLDEIHRFNKAQQDALLPFVERGDVTLIGATTENPSFEVNSALISRTRLFVLQPLAVADVGLLLRRAIAAPHGLAGRPAFAEPALDLLARLSEGDARSALGLLESVAAAAGDEGADPAAPMDAAAVTRLVQTRAARYDKGGDEHFSIISALHKSLRNSDPQAAVYWLARMLESGEDPLYVARRLIRFASEDIGLADPDALVRTVAARDAAHQLGLPEGALALAQAAVYLALAPKSNALYRAYAAAAGEVADGSNPPVPLHLRNAPTRLMKEMGCGDGYVYAHDTADGLGEMTCLPDELAGATFYQPGRRGYEAELAGRMEQIRQWHERRRQRAAGDLPDDVAAAGTEPGNPSGGNG
ncbi:MAG: replication-associated recombination protein A [bacterium]|nr:replication-associated recombination protein A [bacterium]